jgi:beta-lactamase class C
MHNKTILSLLFLALSIAVWLLAQQRLSSSNMATALSPPPLLDSLHQSFVDQFEEYLLKMHEQEPVPALAVAIVKDGQIVFERAWGVRSLTGEKQTIDEHTVFRLASLSKGFTPVLAGILVEKGLLEWSDPVVQYVPHLQLNDPEQTRALNLEHVLSHTTGLPRHAYSNLLNMGRSYESILPMLKNVQLAHAPGVYYNYQNVAYSLSGDALEKAGGKSYEELMAEYVFRPAGMEDASVGYEAMDSLENKAYPHRPDANGFHRIELEPNWYAVAPAAGVNANIRDMGKWLQLLMGYRPDVIADSTLEKIFTPYVSVSTREGNLRPWRDGLDASWYALGWRVMDYYGRRIIYHGGYVNGYRTEIAFDRERDIGLVILSSAPASFIGHCTPAFFDLYRKMAPVGRDVLAE